MNLCWHFNKNLMSIHRCYYSMPFPVPSVTVSRHQVVDRGRREETGRVRGVGEGSRQGRTGEEGGERGKGEGKQGGRREKE